MRLFSLSSGKWVTDVYETILFALNIFKSEWTMCYEELSLFSFVNTMVILGKAGG